MCQICSFFYKSIRVHVSKKSKVVNKLLTTEKHTNFNNHIEKYVKQWFAYQFSFIRNGMSFFNFDSAGSDAIRLAFIFL
jgi:hypothetical protein